MFDEIKNQHCQCKEDTMRINGLNQIFDFDEEFGEKSKNEEWKNFEQIAHSFIY